VHRCGHAKTAYAIISTTFGGWVKQKYFRQLMNSGEIETALSQIAAKIVEERSDLGETLLIGIRRRGVLLAEQLQRKIKKLTGKRLSLGILDITFYRDDLSMVASQPVVEGSHLDFDVKDKEVLLIDDVLYTGRTTRAALESILDYGRPRKIKLVVLVDRGHRELPIQADYVGETVQTTSDEMVEVRMPPIDDEDGVFLTSRELLRKG
jgi:pyrimidine operon attenuation protein / uracil phosphoribosyltransferase